jgi:hypothetical protein
VAHHRLCGYRLLTRTLQREGQVVNHKRVLRLMREDNLLSLRRKGSFGEFRDRSFGTGSPSCSRT